jgi:hypothetical protein
VATRQTVRRIPFSWQIVRATRYRVQTEGIDGRGRRTGVFAIRIPGKNNGIVVAEGLTRNMKEKLFQKMCGRILR